MTTITQTNTGTNVSSQKGALLVAGTCIGGGMLAMPIQTADAGFMISSFVLLASWVFMTFTGFLLIEATLWLKERSHFSSIAQALLGTPGKILSLLVYLFMNSVSLVAYTSGGALLIDHWIKNSTGMALGYGPCCALFTLFFGSCVYFGVTFIGKVNSWFVTLMMLIYCYLVVWICSAIQPEYLSFRPAWTAGLNAFPITLAAFSYQMIVPSLCSYMDYQIRPLKKALLIGTIIPFVIYFLWLLAIHGFIPFEGKGGLHEAAIQGTMIVEPLKAQLSSSWTALLIDGFAFLALVTSYFGLSIALFDFVRDMVKGTWNNPSKSFITLISLAPCLFLAIMFPKALLDFLDISGGFGDALLSGCIPVAMVWIGRYRMKLGGQYQTPGGKLSLIGAAIFACSIFILQWIKLF